MKKPALSILLVLCMVLVLLPPGIAQATDVKYSGGSGTPSDPYLISSAEDMRILANSSGDWNKSFRLTEDVDLGGSEENQWTPIGIGSVFSTNSSPFSGTFDGDGHRISGFYINAPDSNSQGLFGNLGRSGTVKTWT